jgi:cardiolipin synthase
MRRVLIHAIRGARSRVSVMSAYFVPDRRLRRAFADAVRRGVDVRVLVPARSDLPFVQHASRALYGRLLRAGVRIFEWQAGMMHAKATAVDGAWCTIGSFNVDRRSLVHNLEVGVVVTDRGLARELERDFDDDLSACCEVELAAWSRRPLRSRLLERFWHLFRHWL